MKNDVILNSIKKLDELADNYKKDKSTQNLINYIHYRDDFQKFAAFVWLQHMVTSETSWMLQCYEAVITDELGVFDNGKSIPDEEFAKRIKEWANGFEWLE